MIEYVKAALKWLSLVGMITVATALAPAIGLAGATYYVSTTGADSNPGTMDQPFRTIQKGVDVVSAGDTLYIRGGIYVETVHMINSGNAENRIIVSGYPGEEAVIDGNNTLPTGTQGAPDKAAYKALFLLEGSYVELRDLVVRNSRGRGVNIKKGTHNIVDGLKVSYVYDAGIIAETTSDCIIANSEVWETSRNVPWPAAVVTYKATDCVMKGNRVHNNYGEGIGLYGASNIIAEDNVVWDNLKVGIYSSGTSDSVIRNNIVYYTDDRDYWRYGTRPGPGIVVADEINRKEMTNRLSIHHNMVYNAGASFGIWGQCTEFVFRNTVVANNTFVNTRDGEAAGYGLQIIGRSPGENSLFINNIFLTEHGEPVSGNITGTQFSANNWSQPVTGEFSSPDDVIGDPLLAMEGPTGAGQLTADFFKLTSFSPVIDKAKVVPGVETDYFGAAGDMGALELSPFSIGLIVPTTPVWGILPVDVKYTLPIGSIVKDLIIRINDQEVWSGADVPQSFDISALPAGTTRVEAILHAQGDEFITVAASRLVNVAPPIALDLKRENIRGEFKINIGMDALLADRKLLNMTVQIDDKVIYSGSQVRTSFSVDTMTLQDGSHTLIVGATVQNEGGVSETYTTTDTFTTKNTRTKVDDMLPPMQSGWFGNVDSLLTESRSAGWQFITADAPLYFNDGSRMATSGETEEYLIYHAPSLASCTVAVYTVMDDFAGSIGVSVSADGVTWQAADYAVTTMAEAGNLRKLEIRVAANWTERMNWFKITMPVGIGAEAAQLGQVVFESF